MPLTPIRDTGYIAFVKLLQQKTDILATVQLENVSGAIAHYLSTLPSEHLPTFTNIIATSPALWSTDLETRCEPIAAGFRSAVPARLDTERNEEPDASDRHIRREMGTWASAVLEGIVAQRPSPDVRLALLTGLLQGLNDIRDGVKESSKEVVEAEVVIACAELMETIPQVAEQAAPAWTEEFRQKKPLSDTTDRRTVVLRRIAPAILVLSMERLLLLDLEKIAHLGLEEITVLFDAGRILMHLPRDLLKTSDGLILVEENSSFATSIRRLADDPGLRSLNATSKLIARCILGLSDQKSSRATAWKVMTEITQQMERISTAVESDWAMSSLSSVEKEDDFAPETKPTMTSLWLILKSLLFSCILISQSILRTITFESVPSTLSLIPEAHPHALVSCITGTFFHLAFVTSKFGGGLTSHGGGFQEQKRAFYGALDILSSDAWETELFIKRVAGRLAGLNLPIGHPVREARTSFFLACAEQLMPKMSETIIEHTILPVTMYHLSRSDHRETYESAHSVVLSIFANNARVRYDSKSSDDHVSLAQRITPFYMNCLLENSGDGKLSHDQLCLAYSNLVSSATTLDRALAQLCVDKLLATLQASEGPQTHRLRLTLIALISSVDYVLLPPLLSQVKAQVLLEFDPIRRVVLKAAVFKQVLHQIADAEMEIAMRWWLEVRDEFDLPPYVEEEAEEDDEVHVKVEL